jgi:N-acetylglucosamine kinase-like BadF-type ATPase
MKLIVESGATKSTWVLINEGQTVDTRILKGINPTSNPSSVDYVSDYQHPDKEHVTSIHFYGAGVSSPVAVDHLKSSLDAHFSCDTVELEHDILAAARSVSAGQSSIVSILGTGTNTVVFDGSQITQSFKALGYMFADYGSGFHIGKQLLRAYYAHQMNDIDSANFKKSYLEGKDDLLFRIYNSPRPNYETAQLSRFLDQATPELKDQILTTCFDSFFEHQIRPIRNHQDYPLNFVGSIASVFEKDLRMVAKKYGLEISIIEGNPINGLLDYHNN